MSCLKQRTTRKVLKQREVQCLAFLVCFWGRREQEDKTSMLSKHTHILPQTFKQEGPLTLQRPSPSHHLLSAIKQESRPKDGTARKSIAKEKMLLKKRTGQTCNNHCCLEYYIFILFGLRTSPLICNFNENAFSFQNR